MNVAEFAGIQVVFPRPAWTLATVAEFARIHVSARRTARTLASATTFALACAVVASAATAQSPPSTICDAEQALLLDESTPLVLRFEISADGKGFRALWHEYVEQLFAYLDQDGDGALAGKELARSNAWRARPSRKGSTPGFS